MVRGGAVRGGGRRTLLRELRGGGGSEERAASVLCRFVWLLGVVSELVLPWLSQTGLEEGRCLKPSALIWSAGLDRFLIPCCCCCKGSLCCCKGCLACRCCCTAPPPALCTAAGEAAGIKPRPFASAAAAVGDTVAALLGTLLTFAPSWPAQPWMDAHG